MEGILPQASLFIGIIPALVILYISLKGYEGQYKDKHVFLTFAIGIILGFIVALARLLINPLPLMVVFIVLFAFFAQLFKTIVLNVGRLQETRKTTIYGLSLGLGFGSVFTPFLLIAGGASIEAGYYFVSLVSIGAIGIILFHGATGAYIGYGIYSGKLTKYLLTAIILQLPFNALIDMTRFYPNIYFPHFQIILVLYGLLIFLYVFKKIMPGISSKSKRIKKSEK
jgi:hypothetical protein